MGDELPGTAPTSKRFPTQNQAKHCYMCAAGMQPCPHCHALAAVCVPCGLPPLHPGLAPLAARAAVPPVVLPGRMLRARPLRPLRLVRSLRSPPKVCLCLLWAAAQVLQLVAPMQVRLQRRGAAVREAQGLGDDHVPG
eukprot:1475163-Prymnesium_polylepis.1